ncbi:hypothetical protein Ancab_035172 [Ancistrocladus abbreviatus]
MAPITIRRAIGVVKDQRSIGLAKVAGNVDPELEVLIVKATSRDDDVANEKYLREIILKTTCSRPCAEACVGLIYRRIDKTRDWIVVLKALMLLHRLVIDGDEAFKEEILYAFGKGGRMLNLLGFKDEAHSNSWDHMEFVRMYAMYLDEKINFIVSEKKNFVIRNWEGIESEFGGARRVQAYDVLIWLVVC